MRDVGGEYIDGGGWILVAIFATSNPASEDLDQTCGIFFVAQGMY